MSQSAVSARLVAIAAAQSFDQVWPLYKEAIASLVFDDLGYDGSRFYRFEMYEHYEKYMTPTAPWYVALRRALLLAITVEQCEKVWGATNPHSNPHRQNCKPGSKLVKFRSAILAKARRLLETRLNLCQTGREYASVRNGCTLKMHSYSVLEAALTRLDSREEVKAFMRCCLSKKCSVGNFENHFFAWYRTHHHLLNAQQDGLFRSGARSYGIRIKRGKLRRNYDDQWLALQPSPSKQRQAGGSW